MKRQNEFNANYWLARTHSQGYRHASEQAARQRRQHAETVGQAFVATVAYMALVGLVAALALVLA
jgi:hypothetical protein